jgi:regulator of protease activity HflC (stomatin/prohibitin superfamily)
VTRAARRRGAGCPAATSQIAQMTLRSVLGRADLDQLLAERDRLNDDLQKIIDEQTEPWGIKVATADLGLAGGVLLLLAWEQRQ